MSNVLELKEAYLKKYVNSFREVTVKVDTSRYRKKFIDLIDKFAEEIKAMDKVKRVGIEFEFESCSRIVMKLTVDLKKKKKWMIFEEPTNASDIIQKFQDHEYFKGLIADNEVVCGTFGVHYKDWYSEEDKKRLTAKFDYSERYNQVYTLIQDDLSEWYIKCLEDDMIYPFDVNYYIEMLNG